MSAPQALRSERARNSQAQSSTSQSRANGHIGSASQSPSSALVLCAAREQRLLHVPHHLRQQQQPVLQESELVETEHCHDARTTISPSSSSIGSEPGAAALVVRHPVQQRVQQPATEEPGVTRGARSGPHARHTVRQELQLNSAAALCAPPYRCPPAERQSNNHCEATPAGLVAPPLPPRAGKFELQLTSMLLRSGLIDLFVSAS